MTYGGRLIHPRILATVVVCAAAGAAAAQTQTPGQAPDEPPPSSGLRPVRVQITGNGRQLRVRADGPLYVLNEDGVLVD